MIRRRRHAANFTQLPNELIHDERLSYEALGVLAALLSRPGDWEVRLRQLSGGTRRGSGRDRIRRIVRELIEAGYVDRRICRRGNQISGMEYVVQDLAAQPLSKSQETEFQAPEQTSPLLNTNKDKLPLLLSSVGNGGAEERDLDEDELFSRITVEWRQRRKAYPAAMPDSIRRAHRAWAKMTPAERETAAAAIPLFFSRQQAAGRTWPWGLAKYLLSRWWQLGAEDVA